MRIFNQKHAATTADYAPFERILTFQSDNPLCENVTTTEDEVLELAEVFYIAVSSSDPNVTVGAFSSANITILDNDGNQQRSISFYLI